MTSAASRGYRRRGWVVVVILPPIAAGFLGVDLRCHQDPQAGLAAPRLRPTAPHRPRPRWRVQWWPAPHRSRCVSRSSAWRYRCPHSDSVPTGPSRCPPIPMSSPAPLLSPLSQLLPRRDGRQELARLAAVDESMLKERNVSGRLWAFVAGGAAGEFAVLAIHREFVIQSRLEGGRLPMSTYRRSPEPGVAEPDDDGSRGAGGCHVGYVPTHDQARVFRGG
jgi:hypothetical protein